jgi:hypothetical protein
MTPLGGHEDHIPRRRLVIRSLLHPTVLLPILGALLLIPAGGPEWPMGWAVLGVYLAGLEALPAGLLPPDDIVCAAGGRGVTLILSGASQGAADGVKLVIHGGILGATPAP